MKPDWKNAPEWANYLVMDPTGTWIWFENEPTFYVNEQCEGYFWYADDRFLVAYNPVDHYQDSLETRPFNMEKLK